MLKGDAMQNEQESTQDLTSYYQNIFTLKTGKQIEILTRDKIDFAPMELRPSWKIYGFIKNSFIGRKGNSS